MDRLKIKESDIDRVIELSDKYIDAVLNCINPINSSRDISDTENANSGNTDSGAKETKQDDFFSGKIPLEETINTIRNAIELNNI